MRKLSKEEVKEMAFELLKEFDVFCSRHNLIYFLDYGTLLGAVRHNGFIPWDDDVDVSMPRKDYEKLLKLWDKDEGINKNFILISPYENEKLLYRRGKIADNRTEMLEYNKKRPAVFMDIFVIDGIKGKVDNYCKSKKTVNRWVTLYEICCAGAYGNGFSKIVKQFLSFIFKVCGKEKIKYFISKYLDKNYSFYGCDYVGVLGDGAEGLEALPKEAFDVILMQFESINCKAPKGYDDRLKKIYGDYMTPIYSQGHEYDMYLK